MNAKRKMPQRILKELYAARKAATLEKARFGFPTDTVTATHHFEGSMTMHPTDYIKTRTQLYRESWIISALDNVISWAENQENK